MFAFGCFSRNKENNHSQKINDISKSKIIHDECLLNKQKEIVEKEKNKKGKINRVLSYLGSWFCMNNNRKTNDEILETQRLIDEEKSMNDNKGCVNTLNDTVETSEKKLPNEEKSINNDEDGVNIPTDDAKTSEKKLSDEEKSIANKEDGINTATDNVETTNTMEDFMNNDNSSLKQVKPPVFNPEDVKLITKDCDESVIGEICVEFEGRKFRFTLFTTTKLSSIAKLIYKSCGYSTLPPMSLEELIEKQKQNAKAIDKRRRKFPPGFKALREKRIRRKRATILPEILMKENNKKELEQFYKELEDEATYFDESCIRGFCGPYLPEDMLDDPPDDECNTNNVTEDRTQNIKKNKKETKKTTSSKENVKIKDESSSYDLYKEYAGMSLLWDI